MFKGLEPSDKNVLKTIEDNPINRNFDVNKFLSIIDTVGGSTTFAVDGSWGTGKTFFIKQCKMVLDAHNLSIDMPLTYNSENDERDTLIADLDKALSKEEPFHLDNIYYSFYYDAWQNDNDIDPILSLIRCLAMETKELHLFDDNIDAKKIVSSLIDLNPLFKVSPIVECLRCKNALDEVIDSYELKVKIHSFFDELTAEHGDRIIIFIDELDRCKPDYSIQLLERVKHFFNHENIIFVFSVNIEQLEATIKHYYGWAYDAGKYLDRFFDIRVALPEPSLEAISAYHELPFNSIPNRDVYIDLAHYFKMGLRDALKLFNNAGVLEKSRPKINDYTTDANRANVFEHKVIIPYLVALKLTNTSSYNQFVNGEGCEGLCAFINSSSYMKKWINNCYYRDGVSDENYDSVKPIELTKEVYDAVYNTRYSYYDYSKTIENMYFDKEDKEYILRQISWLFTGLIID